MSEVAASAAATGGQAGEAGTWPGAAPTAVDPPISQAALFNAAARAAASNSRRDLVEYLRLRRKPA